MLNLSIASRLYITMAAVGTCLLIVTLGYSFRHERNLVDELALDHVSGFSDSYFEAINTLMLSGGMGQRALLQEKMRRQANIVELRLIRAPTISALFGPGLEDSNPADEWDRQALEGQAQVQRQQIDGKPALTLLQPIVLTADHNGINCLSCHVTSQEGDIAGAVRVSYSLADSYAAINRSMWQQAAMLTLVFGVGVLMLALIYRRSVSLRLERLRQALYQSAERNDLTTQFDTHRNDEIGQLSRSLETLTRKFRESLNELGDNSSHLCHTALELRQTAESTDHAVQALKRDTGAMVETVEQMENAAHGVSQNAQFTAERSVNAQQTADDGVNSATQVVSQIRALVEVVASAATSISELERRSERVGSVIDVISGIAEQTNLLALNAAIEAARAGDQGRGFAVVADEVRSLANRTHDSTDEISQIITELREQSAKAVSSMSSANEAATRSAVDIETLVHALQEIADQSREITQLNAQVSDASSEQSSAVDALTRHIAGIRDIAERSAEDSARDNTISQQLVSLAQVLEVLIDRYKR